MGEVLELGFFLQVIRTRRGLSPLQEGCQSGSLRRDSSERRDKLDDTSARGTAVLCVELSKKS